MSTNGPAISFSGLGTGIDTASMVSALMRLERQPITSMEAKKARVTSEESVVKELNGLVSTLRDRARALSDTGAFTVLTASSSAAGVLTATADSDAAPAVYNVNVTHLAQTHTMATPANPPIGAGTHRFTVGSESVEVPSTATDTVATLAGRINETADSPVAASVVDGKLVIVSRESGAAGQVAYTATAGTPLGLATTQAAQDAELTVNGVPITSGTNTVSGSITGLSLDLVATGTSTVRVTSDLKVLKERVQGFVDAYNAVIDNVGRATKYDLATKTAGSLQGDQTFTSFASQLRGLAGSAVGALGGQVRDSLAQVGITSNPDRSGRLVLNATDFENAIRADPDAVARVFQADDGNGEADTEDGVAVRIAGFTGTFSSETLASRLTGYTDTIKRFDDRIAGLEQVMTVKEARLRQQFTAMETAILRVRAQGSDIAAQLGMA